jgi:rRNA maturation endonuclease Nob1
MYACEDCGWIWPLGDCPPDGSECDNCGGELVPVPQPLPDDGEGWVWK